MSLFDWFAARRKDQFVGKVSQETDESDGLWVKCSECSQVVYRKDLISNQNVCSNCNHHNRINSDERIKIISDEGTFKELDASLSPTDPLGFKDRRSYSDRIRESQAGTGLKDGVITGLCTINSLPLALAVMDFRFMGGSMGSVVGEKITRIIERATKEEYPLLIVCASGGARMQEGMLSLMQMAKISGALKKHREKNLLYMPLLTHPTTGGVTASFAMLGDLILAEPKDKKEEILLEIISCEIAGSTASVRVRDAYIGNIFLDTLSFLKQDGEWKIYNKLFHVESKL